MARKNRNWIWTGMMAVFVSLCSCHQTATDGPLSRPLLHFSSDENWTGEPAGSVYYDGVYHLFYQHNPSDAVLGHIGWGHAVSRDLVDWEELPVAIPSDASGQIYSGSVIADLRNSSGLGTENTSPLIAFYTYQPEKETADRSVFIAYSLDKGLSWTKREMPVLADSESPKCYNPNVSWNEMLNKWLMTVSTGSVIRFYSSSDCLNWSYLSSFGEGLFSEGNWESSSFFPLKADESGQAKWVLTLTMNGGPADGAPGIRYFVGDFNGTAFKISQTQELWVDYGKDHTAGIVINQSPDSSPVMLGWMNSWDYANQLPTHGWCGNLTIPRRLGLKREGNYYILTAAPVEEVNHYVRATYSSEEKIEFTGEKKIFSDVPFPPEAFDLRLLFDNTNRRAIWGARDYGIRFITASGRQISIGYDAELNSFYMDRSRLRGQSFSEFFDRQVGATYTSHAAATDWRLLVDRNSIELFACEGRVSLTALCFPEEPFVSFELYSDRGKTTVWKASLHLLGTTVQK